MTNLRPRLLDLSGEDRESLLRNLDSLADRDTIRTLMEVAQGRYPFHARAAAHRAAERLFTLLLLDAEEGTEVEDGPETGDELEHDA